VPDEAEVSLVHEIAGLPGTPPWVRRWALKWLGYRVLHEARLPDGGSLRVLERGTVRRLRFGEAWEDQSALDRAAPLRPLLPYTRYATLGVALPPRLDRVLHLGLGGGTFPRVVHAAAPGARQEAIEPFPEVVDAARRFFDLPDVVEVTVATAEEPAGAPEAAYDLVVLDAFSHAGLPVGQTEASFARLHGLLRRDGWLLVNATRDARTAVLALHRVFASVAWLKLPDTDQYVIFASDTTSLAGVRARARGLAGRLEGDVEALVDALSWADGSILALSATVSPGPAPG
jgi:spermidine synthase